MNSSGSRNTVDKGERIAKALARAGTGSRREVERMILAGRVTVDGRVLKTPAHLVTSLDGILVDGKPVEKAEAARLWRYHKPRGLVTTNNDPEGRGTVFDHIPKHLPRVISVGRLDLNSEGLLLLTNDGMLARWMEMPTTAWVRRYHVRAHGQVDEKKLRDLALGTSVDGVVYEPIEARLEKTSGHNSWLTVALKEGKNREVRRVLASVGLEVNRLIRTAYGPFTLGTMPRGMVTEVPSKVLYQHCGEILVDPASSSVAAQTRKAPSPQKWAKAKPKPTRPGARRGSGKAPSKPQRGD